MKLNRVTEDVHWSLGEHELFLEDDKVAEQEVECLHNVDLLVRRSSGQKKLNDATAIVDIVTGYNHQDDQNQGVVREMGELLSKNKLTHLIPEWRIQLIQDFQNILSILYYLLWLLILWRHSCEIFRRVSLG